MLSCLLNNQRINCQDYSKETLKQWSDKNILICPACGKPYEYCHGKVIQPYFRHKDKQECLDIFSESETEEHKNGKKDIYEWLKKQENVTDIVLEGWILKTKQRPDIMFKYNDIQYVIEFQCTPISSEYYERHELYKASGIKDIWICGVEKYLQCYHNGNGIKKVSELEKNSYLYYDYKNKNFYQVENINENKFKDIFNNKKYHLMLNQYDYVNGMKNYFLLKDELKSYNSKNKWKSRHYPTKEYYYNRNYSLGRCYKINNIKLKNIR